MLIKIKIIIDQIQLTSKNIFLKKTTIKKS